MQNLERADQADQLKLDQERRQLREQQLIRQVLSAGLPDDQAIKQLRMLGYHDVASNYEQGIVAMNKILMDMDRATREKHAAEAAEDARNIDAGLGAAPERQAEFWAEVGDGSPFDSDRLKMLRHRAVSFAEATARINAEQGQAGEQRKQAEFEAKRNQGFATGEHAKE